MYDEFHSAFLKNFLNLPLSSVILTSIAKKTTTINAMKSERLGIQSYVVHIVGIQPFKAWMMAGWNARNTIIQIQKGYPFII